MIDTALIILESAINRCLRTDLQSVARLQELDGKRIRLEISDWNLFFYIIPKHHGIELRTQIDGEADTTISGTLQNLVRIGIAEDKQHAIKKHHIQFSGDVHVGMAMQQILSHLDIDWEAYLSTMVGDHTAHLISKGAKRLLTIGKDIAHSLKRNTAEYIHHEAKLSPTRDELEQFYHDVSTLRNDVERLEQKINQC